MFIIYVVYNKQREKKSEIGPSSQPGEPSGTQWTGHEKDAPPTDYVERRYWQKRSSRADVLWYSE